MSAICNLRPADLKQRLTESNTALVLLDVRQPWEFEIGHIAGSVSLPLGELRHVTDLIEQDKEVVLICHHGVRSLQAAIYMRNLGYQNLCNLAGGLEAWSLEVDPSVPRY